MPAAFTATAISPTPGWGSGCSRHSSAPSTMVTACMAGRLSVAEGDVVADAGAGVELAGPGDPLVLLEQLHPVRQPARRARDGEEHREHLHREAHRLVDEPRVEVDVRVELARDEVVVGQ